MVEAINKTRRKVALVPLLRLLEWLICQAKAGKWEISLVLIGSKRMRSLNRDYRGIDNSTDILTFPGGSFAGVNLGEIFVSLEEIQKDRKYQFISDVSAKDRLSFIIIHGWLHLLGYDDVREKDRLEMIAIGRKLLVKAQKDGII